MTDLKELRHFISQEHLECQIFLQIPSETLFLCWSAVVLSPNTPLPPPFFLFYFFSFIWFSLQCIYLMGTGIQETSLERRITSLVHFDGLSCGIWSCDWWGHLSAQKTKGTPTSDLPPSFLLGLLVCRGDSSRDSAVIFVTISWNKGREGITIWELNLDKQTYVWEKQDCLCVNSKAQDEHTTESLHQGGEGPMHLILLKRALQKKLRAKSVEWVLCCCLSHCSILVCFTLLMLWSIEFDAFLVSSVV